LSDIQHIDREVDLDGIQIHGDESPDEFARIAAAYLKVDEQTSELVTHISHEPESESRSTILSMIAQSNRSPVIRARRLDSQGVSSIVADINACHAA
jgi:phosphoribosylanthranilate isomerase